MPLATPSPPVLFGTTATVRDASRTSDSLRFDWADVRGAVSYDIQYGSSDVRTNVGKGVYLGGLASNRSHVVRLRAVNATEVSSWSTAASYATRPSKPSRPFLQSGDDRHEDRLRVDWSTVDGLLDYEMQVNNALLPGIVQRPFMLTASPGGGPLLPNMRYDIAVRARDDAVGGVSEWSDPGTFVTRPPKPSAPTRVPSDLFGWGVVIRWSIAPTFNAGSSAFARLLRDTNGTVGEVIVDGGTVTGGLLSGRYVDVKQRMSMLKTYRLQAVVPAAFVAAPIPVAHGGPDNQSFDSDAMTATLPYFVSALRPQRAFPAAVVRVPITITTPR